jgi:hypothetical protein
VKSVLKKVGIKERFWNRPWASNLTVTQGTWFDDLKGFFGYYDHPRNKQS